MGYSGMVSSEFTTGKQVRRGRSPRREMLIYGGGGEPRGRINAALVGGFLRNDNRASAGGNDIAWKAKRASIPGTRS